MAAHGKAKAAAPPNGRVLSLGGGDDYINCYCCSADRSSKQWSLYAGKVDLLRTAPALGLGRRWLLEYDGENFQDDCTGYIIHLTLYS